MTEDLRSRLQEDLKAAMKAQDTTARETIRFTMAALKNAEIDKGGSLSPEEQVATLQREAKRRADSIEQFRSADRRDLVEREESQLAVLQRYMPAAMSDDELESIVSEVIQQTGAREPRDLGKVMPILMQRAAGRADGKRLSDAVRKALSA
jgi:uncharacterized protein